MRRGSMCRSLLNIQGKQQIIQNGEHGKTRQEQGATITDIKQLTKYRGKTRTIYTQGELVCGERTGAVVLWLPSHHPSGCCTLVVVEERSPHMIVKCFGYSRHLTLDLNTANRWLRLSENNRVVTHTFPNQPYPYHPDRFDVYQVLCRQRVCGRCYWEIEWSGCIGVSISVSYKSISRKGDGDECVFGYNDRSWSLSCCRSSYSFTHNKVETRLPVEPISSRIGVLVDVGAGTLSFYSVSDTMSLIHTEQITFTQTLYAGFGVYPGSSVKLC
ncbi:Stonustoxin subunit alpha [Labeo rohita]|uniref:Stonustoxin subunit alpha n=1 Tax=Labeo rohita TaxID=84645 RepID=A0ABQ8LKB1_LABRO|nr:Stonustoxin subunit alpha [Labeo rohita]